MIKHLIFDFDGVIIDSEILAARSFVKILSDMNIYYDENSFASKYAGHKMITVVENLSKKYDIGDKKIFLNKVMKHVSKIFSNELKPVTNIGYFLKKNKLTRYIASNSGKQRIIKGLSFLSLESFFNYDKIYTFEMVKNAKPSPDVYIKVIKDNNLNENEVLVLEDSIAGVKAAKGANLSVIGITAGSHWVNRSSKELLEAGSIAIIDNYLNFDILLKNLNRAE